MSRRGACLERYERSVEAACARCVPDVCVRVSGMTSGGRRVTELGRETKALVLR